MDSRVVTVMSMKRMMLMEMISRQQQLSHCLHACLSMDCFNVYYGVVVRER